ncbi:RdgB/HAM1 family non-canonical purine NTP pyrophosphatase [bacterium]|nr:RdgB/HAM1 family non-canonical purine NTP pyrophosphatase [bacterium]
MKIVLASSNIHKVQEINEIVKSSHPDLDLEFVLPPEDFDPDENGKTFEENSYIKAHAAWKLSKTWTLADDSGLCIDALGGNPGIYSARYAETPVLRIQRVLRELEGVAEEKRTARFCCAMTLINPKGDIEYNVLGKCEGKIISQARGINGFGYDPIFVPDGYNTTIAELSEEEKNEISHRGNALREVLRYICNK